MKGKFSVLLYTILVWLVSVSCPDLVTAQTPFERMDRDGDGRLSRSEFRGPPQAFGWMDRNNDGYITGNEAAGTRLSRGVRQARQVEESFSAGESREAIYVDTHNHLVGRRAMGQLEYERPVRIALASMDATGVKLNLIMPMPQGVHQKYRLYLEDLLPVVKTYPARFVALGGGGSLNVLIQKAVNSGSVTAVMEEEFDKRAADLVQKGVAGFGEMAAEHFSMKGDHPYESAPPDHPLFLRLADLAAEYDLPVDIHMEAVPEEMAMPSRFQSPPNPAVLKPNIAAFNRLLAHNHKAKIVWAHLGWDNTGKRTIELTRRILLENQNLCMSIRIASGMRERKVVKPTFPLDVSGCLKEEWQALFQEFPDRFLIGSDEIILPGNNHPSSGSIRSTVGILEQLPTNLKHKIGYENAYRLYKLKK